MAEARYLNFITGFTAGAPNQSQFYLMGVDDDAKVFNDEMNFMGDSSIQGFALQPDRREAAPQVPVGSVVGGYGSTADGNLEWTMANSDDPRSSGGKFIHPDRYNNGGSNYPPQIGQ
jgi:hypothetical protein